jgi:hypothetical protein
MAKSKVTATAAFCPSKMFPGHVTVFEATARWSRDKPEQSCGHDHADMDEAKLCHASPKNEKGQIYGSIRVHHKPLAQVRPYTKPVRTAATRKRKQVTA